MRSASSSDIAAVCEKSDATRGQVGPCEKRHAEDRTRRRAKRTRSGRVGALGGQRHASTERIRGAEKCPDVPRVRHLPQREDDVTRRGRKVGSSVDADDTRRVPERGHLAEELRKHVLSGDEQLDRFDAGTGRRLHEVLALDGEETRLVAVLARREKLPDEPELLVLARLDQAASASASAASAAFARSATTANACGSLTAMSASDLRSSSIPAFFTPAMNRL